MQQKREAIVVVEQQTEDRVTDATLQLNQLLVFNRMLAQSDPDGGGFFDPSLLLDLWCEVTMQPSAAYSARVSKQNVGAEMTLGEWFELVCLLAIRSGDGSSSSTGGRQRAAPDTIQRFILRELFALASVALDVAKDKLSETAAQRERLEGKAHRVALAGMLAAGGQSSDAAAATATRVPGQPRRLSVQREITEEERLEATRSSLAGLN
jgi:hypothetical protein